MQGVRLGDHRIPRCNGGREITAAHAVERKRKIVRPEDYHRSDWCIARTKPLRLVDDRPAPCSLAGRRRRLPQLIGRPGQFHIFQPWRNRQRRLLVGCLRDRFRIRIELLRVRLQKPGNLLRGDPLQGLRRFHRRGQSPIAIAPAAHREPPPELLPRSRVLRLKCGRGIRLPPLSADPDLRRLHPHSYAVVVGGPPGLVCRNSLHSMIPLSHGID